MPTCLLFHSSEPHQLESITDLLESSFCIQQPLTPSLQPLTGSSHDHGWVGIEGRRLRIGVGKILEGRRQGLCLNCLTRAWVCPTFNPSALLMKHLKYGSFPAYMLYSLSPTHQLQFCMPTKASFSQLHPYPSQAPFKPFSSS